MTREEAEKLVELTHEHGKLVLFTRALIDALPKCTQSVLWHEPDGTYGPCLKPATKAYARGGARYCDACAPADCPDYPRAAPLRALLAMLKP